MWRPAACDPVSRRSEERATSVDGRTALHACIAAAAINGNIPYNPRQVFRMQFCLLADGTVMRSYENCKKRWGAACHHMAAEVEAGRWGAQVLLCADLWKDEQVLHAAYCDGRGVTEAFIRNGVAHAFRSLGPAAAAAADPASWDYEVRKPHALPQRFSPSCALRRASLPTSLNCCPRRREAAGCVMSPLSSDTNPQRLPKCL